MASIDDVQDISPRSQYTAAASQTVFAYPFPISDSDDITVDVDDVIQTRITDYTVSGVGDDNGGSVTFVTPLTGGEIVTLYRDTSIARLADFQQNGPFSSETHNDELDKITLILQELESKIGRCIRFPLTGVITDAQTELEPLSDYFGRFLRITSTGLLEAAVALDNVTALSAELIGQFLNPQTATELAAGITPTRFAYETGNIMRYGATMDNVADDYNAYLEAGQTGKVYVPDIGGGISRVATAVTFNNPVEFDMAPGVVIRPDMLSGNMFTFNTDGVHIRRMVIDGTGSTGTLTDNLRLLVFGDLITERKDIVIDYYTADNVFLSDGLTEGSNLLVTHPLWFQRVEGVEVGYYRCDTVSGSGVFARELRNSSFDSVLLRDCQWYAFNVDYGCENVKVGLLDVNCQLATGTYYGGGLNVMSNTDGARNKALEFDKVVLKGNYSYGTAVRILSVDGCTVGDLRITDWDTGTWTTSPDVSAVRIETRGVQYNVSGATSANPIEITATGHTYSTGDTVQFANLPGDFGTNLNGVTESITVTGPNTFTIAVDGSVYTAYTSGGTAANENGPCKDVTIGKFYMEPPATEEEHRAIYVGNLYQGARNPVTGLSIGPGRIVSLSTTQYFLEGIILHGQEGGIEVWDIEDSVEIVNYGIAGSSEVVGGAIGCTASNAAGAVLHGSIGKVKLRGLGTPTDSKQVGIQLGAYTDYVTIKDRGHIDNYWFHTRTLTNAGNNNKGFDNFDHANIGSAAIVEAAGAEFDPIGVFANSDATPDVTGNNRWQTGTVLDTIQDFDGGFDGQEITVISKAAITYDTTGTSLVGSSVDIVTADGDVTRWIRDGSDWRLVAFVDISVDNSGGA